MNKDLLIALGWDTFFQEQFESLDFHNSFPARVVAQKSKIYDIISESQTFTAKVTGKFYFQAKQNKDFPVVGDWVICQAVDDSGEALIHKVLKRKNCFARKMPISGGRKLKNGVIDGGITEEQVIASNMDTIFIMCGVDANFSISRIERYLTLIRHQQLPAVVLLNKVDICEKPDEYLSQVKDIAFDIPVFPVSAITKTGLEQLDSFLKEGKTLVLLGSSGVGKSTLLNALANKEIQTTNNISYHSGKGRHTTTRRQMFFHSSGCLIIDTPGMKELQLWAETDDLDFVYHDVIEVIAKCKFSNCTHKNEHGCAVKFAIGDGSLSKERFERYLSQQKELKRLDEKKKEYRRNQKKRGGFQ